MRASKITTAVVFDFVRVSEHEYLHNLPRKRARKILNCYRMFAELREALEGGRALDKGERLIASSAPGHKHLRQPVLVVQFLFEASDLATEVTPKASSTCENEAEGVQRKPSTKRALFSDQFSELEDEITSPISRSRATKTCGGRLFV